MSNEQTDRGRLKDRFANGGPAYAVAAAPAQVGHIAAGGADPWPDGHQPAGEVERDFWRAFAELAKVERGPLSLSRVARDAGHSRTMISHDGGGMPVLRRVILDEIARRKAVRDADRAPPSMTPEEEEAAAQAKREGKVNHWRAAAREADGRNADYLARAVAAEARTTKAMGVLRRILDDVKAGRWVRADPSSVLLGEIEVVLGPPAQGAKQIGHAAVE